MGTNLDGLFIACLWLLGCFFSPEDTICVGNTPVIHNGLLGMPLPPALAGYGFARPPGMWCCQCFIPCLVVILCRENTNIFIVYISSDRSFYTLNISREGLLVTLDLNGVKFEVMGCRWLNLTTWAKTRVVVEYSQWQFVYFFLSSKCISCQPFRTGICIICNQTRNHFWLWTGNFHPWWVWLNKFTNKPDSMTHKRVLFGGEPEKWNQEY